MLLLSSWSLSSPYYCYYYLQNSEEPIYRISSLEGQLRLYQAKLTEAHHKHSAELASQQVRHEEKLATLQAEYDEKMKEAAKRIEELEKQCSSSSQVPALSISRAATPTPPPLLKTRRYKRRSDGLTSSNSSSKFKEPTNPEAPITQDSDGRTSRIAVHDKPRSASYDNISAAGLDETPPTQNNSYDQYLSPDKAEVAKEVNRKNSTDRLTITDLFERSLVNPSSMSTIRKEIKADGLTPKMERKFQNRGSATNSAKLPSVSPKSSLIQDSRNGRVIFGKEVLGKKNSEQ